MNDKNRISDENESMVDEPSSQTSNPVPEPSLEMASQSDKKPGYELARDVGARLAQMREEKNWALDDISAHLKVSVAKLRALEAGELDKLPGPAFAVGLLRSYAKLIAIDPTPFIKELHRVDGLFKTELSAPGMHGGSLPRNHESVIWKGRLKKGRVWLIGIAVALICLALYWNSASVHWSADVKGTNLNLNTPAALNQAKPETPAAVSSSATLASTSSVPAVAAAASAASMTAQVSANQPSQVHLSSIHFKVSQDNWVSIRQQDGKEIYGGVLYQGQERTVKGVAPFKLIVGNQTGLESIELDGKRVDPSKYANARQNNVVHFNLP